MTLINIGIAGSLGRMGRELVKEIANNKLLNIVGGFEHLQRFVLEFTRLTAGKLFMGSCSCVLRSVFR